MPKALCITGMVISILVLILFLLDLVAPEWIAPFEKANRVMDLTFILCAAATGVLSWITLREQT